MFVGHPNENVKQLIRKLVRSLGEKLELKICIGSQEYICGIRDNGAR